ncbi:hypothetical protein L1987_48237 [Smallanthus sonchifolius]|uniref:Uncharacterized protein n=1 Tax=Smallanthus sonchifolius TaxID=185202 RepID=A0ACB9FRH1_9ASTR|nr:hypothetical protein L1987_48237 [Smallanthus sonchifolius]
MGEHPWEETFNHFGSKLDRKTAVHNWLGDGVAEQVVKVGLSGANILLGQILHRPYRHVLQQLQVLHSDHRKFNKDITVGLIRRRLMNLAEYSFHMAMLINTEFAISLVKTLETGDGRVTSELRNITDALAKATYRRVAKNDNDHHALRSSELDPLRRQIIALFQCILCFANFYELSLMYSAILFIKLI